jgi:hypothetical protein
MKLISVISVILTMTSCLSTNGSRMNVSPDFMVVDTEEYRLVHVEQSDILLILFPGAGGTADGLEEEFPIREQAKEAGISLLLMNFSHKLWIEAEETGQLAGQIERIIKEHALTPTSIYIGGMSIGGNMALTLASYLIESESTAAPAGVFAVDAPIDLHALFLNAATDVLRSELSEERLQEPRFIIDYLQKEFGDEDALIESISKVSPVVLSQWDLHNIDALRDIRLRLYTEPDSLWWRENRQTDHKNTNAYVYQQTKALMDKREWTQVELIETRERGYRASGERHPHSWSIVDKQELVEWMLN